MRNSLVLNAPFLGQPCHVQRSTIKAHGTQYNRDGAEVPLVPTSPAVIMSRATILRVVKPSLASLCMALSWGQPWLYVCVHMVHPFWRQPCCNYVERVRPDPAPDGCAQ